MGDNKALQTNLSFFSSSLSLITQDIMGGLARCVELVVQASNIITVFIYMNRTGSPAIILIEF